MAFLLWITLVGGGSAAAAEDEDLKQTTDPAWKIIPRISLTETFTDNANLNSGPSGRPHADQITQISPGIRIDGKTARLQVFADYSLSAIDYAQDSRGSQMQNALNSLGTFEAIEKWGYLDFSGTVAQTSISALGTPSTTNASANGNSTEKVSVGLNVSQVTLAPDGEYLAYSVVTNRSNIWRVKEPATGPVSSRTAERVTTDQESIESFWISRDGQWLVFDSDRAGIQQVFRRRLSGGEVQQVTRGTAPAFSVSLSPDGKQVGYHAIVNGLRRVFVTSSEGGEAPVQVSPGAFQDERNPQWSPDGQRLAWTTIQDGVQRAQVVTRAALGWGPRRWKSWWNTTGFCWVRARSSGLPRVMPAKCSRRSSCSRTGRNNRVAKS